MSEQQIKVVEREREREVFGSPTPLFFFPSERKLEQKNFFWPEKGKKDGKREQEYKEQQQPTIFKTSLQYLLR